MPMNINLTPQLEEVIRKKVNSGSYNSASEVVREALRLMEHEDRIRAVQLQRLRQDIEEGFNSGAAIPFDPEELKRIARKARAAQRATGSKPQSKNEGRKSAK